MFGVPLLNGFRLAVPCRMTMELFCSRFRSCPCGHFRLASKPELSFRNSKDARKNTAEPDPKGTPLSSATWRWTDEPPALRRRFFFAARGARLGTAGVKPAARQDNVTRCRHSRLAVCHDNAMTGND